MSTGLTKAQKEVPMESATQIDPEVVREKAVPGDDELVADPKTRGWARAKDVMAQQEESDKADKANVEKAQKEAAKDDAKNEADEDHIRGSLVEDMPDEVKAEREYSKELQEEQEEKAAEAGVISGPPNTGRDDTSKGGSPNKAKETGKKDK